MQNQDDEGSLSTFLIRVYSWTKLIYFPKLGYMSKIRLVKKMMRDKYCDWLFGFLSSTYYH